MSSTDAHHLLEPEELTLTIKGKNVSFKGSGQPHGDLVAKNIFISMPQNFAY